MSILGELAALDPDEWPNRLRRLVIDLAKIILHCTVDPDQSFADHGLDSLSNLELRTHIETKTGVRINPEDHRHLQHCAHARRVSYLSKMLAAR